MRRVLVLLVTFLLLPGCLRTVPMCYNNVANVCFYGNIHTNRAAVENDVLYRSAEITLKRGFDYFVTGPSNSVPGYHPILVNCEYPYCPRSHYYAPQALSIIRIKMFCGSKPDDMVNAYDAHEIILYNRFNSDWKPPH